MAIGPPRRIKLMKKNKLILGISVIVIVIAIFIIANKMASIRPPEHKTLLFPDIEERQVTAIALNDGANGVRLDKGENGWTVTNASTSESHPADSASAQIAVEKIVSMKKSDLVSENPAKQASFEVDSASGLTVEIFTKSKDKPAETIKIGKSGHTWNSNYVRVIGSDAVYLISGGLRYTLFTDFEQWKKKPAPEPEAKPEGSDWRDNLVDTLK
jgi:hypothetical protein